MGQDQASPEWLALGEDDGNMRIVARAADRDTAWSLMYDAFDEMGIIHDDDEWYEGENGQIVIYTDTRDPWRGWVIPLTAE